MTWHTVARLADLPEGQPKVHQAGSRPVLVTRIGDEVFATEPVCPHKFAGLEAGTVEPNCFLACPLHDAHFDLRTGETRPGDEWAGTLPTFPVRIAGESVEVLAE